MVLEWLLVVTVLSGPGAPFSMVYGFTDRAPCEAWRETLARTGHVPKRLGTCRPGDEKEYRRLEREAERHVLDDPVLYPKEATR